MTLSELLATPEYSSLSNEDALALVNNPRHEKLVERRFTYITLADTDILGQVAPGIARRLILTVNAVKASDPLVEKADKWLDGEVAVRDSSGKPGLDISETAIRDMLDQFADNPALSLTTADAAAIKGLAVVMESDAEKHRLGKVELKNINWARQS